MLAKAVMSKGHQPGFTNAAASWPAGGEGASAHGAPDPQELKAPSQQGEQCVASETHKLTVTLRHTLTQTHTHTTHTNTLIHTHAEHTCTLT